MLVTQEKINSEKITILLHAVEREVDITIGSDYNTEELLGDLALRFEKSKHLDATRKDEYFRIVHQLSQDIREEELKEEKKIIPRDYSKIIDHMKTAVEKGDKRETIHLIEELKSRLILVGPPEEIPSNPFLAVIQIYSKIYRRHPRRFRVLTLSVVLFYIIILLFALWFVT